MWRDDGWDAEYRIGLLCPAGDVGPESEIKAMAPPGVGVHATRVPFGAMAPGGTMDPTIPLAPVRDFAGPPHVDDAVELLSVAPIHAIAFGFTSSAYVIGADGEAAMIERLLTRSRGIPVVATGAGAIDALGVLGARRVALVDPPWFDAELNKLGRAYYESAGFDVAFAAPSELPSAQIAIRPDELHDWVVANVPSDVDVIVIGGNGFRAVGIIEALEAKFDRPVLTANQVLFWAALRAAGAPTSGVKGYGRIFAA